MRTARPRSVVLINPCGWGNLGDAAILQAVIDAARARWPGVELAALTVNPEDTQARHGIPAFPLLAFQLKTYGVKGQPTAGGIRSGLRAVARERAARPREAALLARCDLLVVAGGGQLDDYWGGAWGHPYALWKWTRAARRRGIPIAILSTGFGTARSPLSRRFLRGALLSAGYRSVRDRGSLELARSLAPEVAFHLAPDLAFGAGAPAPEPPAAAASRRIGISPMAFADPRVWPEKDASRYAEYMRRLADLVRACARAGHEVHLFSTDGPDRRVVTELAAAAGDARVVAHDTATVGAALDVLAGLDLVVASRLHGVILALVAGRPVVAISYERKVERVMTDFGLERFTVPIDACDAPSVQERLDRLWQERAAVLTAVNAQVRVHRAELAEQYGRVFALAREVA